MAQATYVHDGGAIDYTPGAAVAAGPGRNWVTSRM